MKHLTFSIGIGMSIMIYACSPRTNRANDAPNHYPETILGWKLGAQAYTFKRFTFFEAVEKIDSCQLRYVEGYPGQELGAGIKGKLDFKVDQLQQRIVLDALKKRKVKMVAFGVVKPADVAEWRQLFTFAKAMGIQTLVTEPDKNHIDLISKLCDEFKISVAIHNHANPSPYWHPDSVLAVVKGRSKYLGACADVGHWVRSGLDPTACLKKLDGRVLHLHMKDLDKKNTKSAHDLIWGTGVTGIPEIIQELKRQQFKGIISAEYEYNWLSNSVDVAQSVAWFRRNLDVK